MAVVMREAFIGALITDLGANTAHFPGTVTPQAHELGGGITDRGALLVELDAAGHHFPVFFFQAGRGTMLAPGSAFQAGIDTFFKGMMVHNKFVKREAQKSGIWRLNSLHPAREFLYDSKSCPTPANFIRNPVSLFK